MKKILYVLLVLLLIPLGVKAEAGTDIKTLEKIINGNIVSFSGTTQDDSVAVMCKLMNGEEQVSMLSVEVDNNKAFAGSFIAPSTGTYTVSCANYDGGAIKTAEANVESMTIYTVTFDTNGGSSIDAVQVESGQVVARPEQNPRKDNYDFAGWYEDSTLIHEFDFSKRITANTTIYAKWVAATVQVQTIFFGDGGTYQVDFETDDPDNQGSLGAPITSSQRYFVTANTMVTLTANSIGGYHFNGWYRTHEENEEWLVDDLISSNTTYEFNSDTIDSYINIMPVFEENTVSNMVTVTFEPNDGSEPWQVNLDSGQPVERPEQDPTRDGYTFAGWYEDDTLTHEFDFIKPITLNTTIYAKWIEIRPADQIQIWATTGGKVAAQYTPSAPNTENLEAKDGTNFVANGEIVGYYINDEVTAIAKADNGYKFLGWKHANTENEIPEGSEEPPKCIGEVFSTSTSYTYKPSVTVVPDDDQPIRYVCAAFAKEYSVSDEDGNSISFAEEVGHTYRLVISDLSNLTDEQLSSMDPPMDRETYDGIRNTIIEAAKQYGTLISFLEIDVLNESDETLENVPVTIRIKLTDEMKKYNTFKLIYVKDDMSLGTVTNLTIDGDYLVGSLEHLSAYTLVGSIESIDDDTVSTTTKITTTTSSTSSNPKTFDNAYILFIAFGISMIGLLFSTFKILKLKK